MPPRLPAPLGRAVPKLYTPKPRLQPFSTTRPQNGRHGKTLLFAWLRGEGKQFESYEGHSNYLTNMYRRRDMARAVKAAEEKSAQGVEEEEAAAAGEGEQSPAVQEMMRAAERQEAENDTAKGEGRDTKGKEREKKFVPSSQPFPLNPAFRSQPVLSEKAREMIWSKVKEQGESLKAVSAELGVDIRRVAAVFRLKEVEKNWVAQGKRLAHPYSKAVMAMLPQTNYRPNQRKIPHEPINEIHAHGLAMQQLFLPVSESRHFTRDDAAKAFHRNLLSADKRVPHPELVQMERDRLNGMEWAESQAKFEAAAMASQVAVAEAQQRKKAKAAAKITAVARPRVEYRFTNINVDDVGKNGRARKGVGWRYGWPYPDRKTGQVKIPTKVE